MRVGQTLPLRPLLPLLRSLSLTHNPTRWTLLFLVSAGEIRERREVEKRESCDPKYIKKQLLCGGGDGGGVGVFKKFLRMVVEVWVSFSSFLSLIFPFSSVGPMSSLSSSASSLSLSSCSTPFSLFCSHPIPASSSV